MQILAVPYAIALVAAAGLCQLLPAGLRPLLLALLSLGVYALFGGWQALIIVGLLLAVFGLAQAIARTSRTSPTAQTPPWPRLLTGLGIALCIGVLAYFKYAGFLAQAARELVALLPHRAAAPPAEPTAAAVRGLAVPLGISFFTFEFVHFLVDVYRRQISPLPADAPPRQRCAEFVHFAAFALFFPTLLAGPIKRYQTFAEGGPASREDLAYGLGRMLIGLCKKLILADSVAPFALRLWVPDQTSPLGLWLAMYAYAAQIYFDFSGYSDLAIGAARLLGYRVPENFDWPYLAPDLPTFWRRWHISLSSWIRDYLYIPLGGNRGGSPRVSVNLIVVMALCGLWHGPAWHFVVWGLWHGLGLAVTRLWRGGERRTTDPGVAPSRLRAIVARLATFHFVCFGWLWFAAPSVEIALRCLLRMLRLAP